MKQHDTPNQQEGGQGPTVHFQWPMLVFLGRYLWSHWKEEGGGRVYAEHAHRTPCALSTQCTVMVLAIIHMRHETLPQQPLLHQK